MSHNEGDILYDVYSLQASAEAEVVNDLMIAQLRVEHEDRDPAKLADKVNSDMAWALEQLKAYDAIDSNTQNYSTHPKYEQNRVVGWRSMQTLRLQGSDFEQLKKALQVLQSKLKIGSMRFQPRDETRKLTEDSLIREALENFKQRATIVQENMGAASYRIMQTHIDTGSGGRVPVRHMAMEATAMRSVDAAPAVEAGESVVTVTVSGQIQLQ